MIQEPRRVHGDTHLSAIAATAGRAARVQVMKLCHVLLVTVMAARVLVAQPPSGTGAFKGRFNNTIFDSSRDTSLQSADAALLPSSLRPRFQRFLRCHATFRSRLAKPDGFFAEAAIGKQQAVERAIACLIEARGAAELAADYAAQARILYEWEGVSSSPLEEAAYAERYINDHPSSPLVPYLCLFVAQRARYAFEFVTAEKNSIATAAVAARYRSFIARARRTDPLVAVIADDLDGLPFVYRNVGKHPRDF